MAWQPGRLARAWDETKAARTLRFDVPGWPGHLAGQHVDVRLTAEDGYTAQRSYSMSAPDRGAAIEITVQLVDDGEVSPYLVQDIAEGDRVEVRGPLGRWFVWRPEQAEPVLLIAGGSGIAPLIAIRRAHAESGSTAPMRLIYSVRTPEDVYFSDELRAAGGSDVAVLYTRRTPAESQRPAGRIDVADLDTHRLPATAQPTCYVCGPTPFVEAVTELLARAGHDPTRVRAERFGPTGG